MVSPLTVRWQQCWPAVSVWANASPTLFRPGYERWDGNGYPARLEGEAIPVEIRIAIVARDIDLFSWQGANVREMLERRRGKAYDPAVVDAAAGLDVQPPEADWEEVLAAEPKPVGCCKPRFCG